jgi:hypothetical protein
MPEPAPEMPKPAPRRPDKAITALLACPNL